MKHNDRDEIRAEMRRRRAALDEASREEAAHALARRLLTSRFYRSAGNIGAYLAAASEIDLSPVIEHAWTQGKHVYVPVIESSGKARMRFARLRPDTQLIRNRYGINEPHPEQRVFIESRRLDLVLVPLVAFDRQGHRLGMGGGYYDRCFSYLRHRSHWKKPRLCGVAYAFQETDEITPADWDIPLDRVVTDSALILTGSKQAQKQNHLGE